MMQALRLLLNRGSCRPQGRRAAKNGVWTLLLLWNTEENSMAEGRGFNNNPGKNSSNKLGQDQRAADAGGTLRAGIDEISGVKKEDLEQSLAESRKSLRSAIDWVQGNYGVLIAGGLGIATVGFVMLWLNRRDGLRHFYEEETANPTLH